MRFTLSLLHPTTISTTRVCLGFVEHRRWRNVSLLAQNVREHFCKNGIFRNPKKQTAESPDLQKAAPFHPQSHCKGWLAERCLRRANGEHATWHGSTTATVINAMTKNWHQMINSATTPLWVGSCMSMFDSVTWHQRGTFSSNFNGLDAMMPVLLLLQFLDLRNLVRMNVTWQNFFGDSLCWFVYWVLGVLTSWETHMAYCP